ncbi:PH domain-containing protein [Streptomyces sp. NPDC005573]|uniref:PH domain-containing protein n=1 Tax=Streptomyces sp. NPDC005573 TaxID=3156890 RepID=UPI0033AF2734
MTTPDHKSPAPQLTVPLAKDRIYRSPMALVAGVMMLGIAGWLGFDALVRGHGHTPWLALAGMLMLFPLIVAFTLRPAVFAGEERLRVRNPFRVVTLPWGEIEFLRSGFTNEVVAKSGTKYQLWSVPVSLRARKKASRNQSRAVAQAARGGAGRGGLFGGGGLGSFGGGAFGGDVFGNGSRTAADPTRAETDKIMDELRETLERRSGESAAQGGVTVRWAYEVMAPAAAGAVLLAILLATG